MHVVALFEQPSDAERAIQDLIAKNIPSERISTIVRDDEIQQLKNPTASAAEGAAAGLTTGAMIGGVLGLLAGAGIGFFPAGLAIAGPLSGLLAGGAAGAATGGIFGGLVGLGIPSNLIDHLQEGIQKGGVVLAVEAGPNDVDTIEETLDRDGAAAIHEQMGEVHGEAIPQRRAARYVRQDPPQKEAEIPDGRREVNAEHQPEPYEELFSKKPS